MSKDISLEAFALWPIPPEYGAIDAGGQASAADCAVRQEVKLGSESRRRASIVSHIQLSRRGALA